MELRDICSIRSGLTLRERLSDVRQGGTLAVQQGDLTAAGEFVATKAIRIAAPNRSSHRISSEELVFRSRGPFWSAWAPGDYREPLVAIAPLFILTPVTDIDAAYVAWYIGRPDAQNYLASEAVGTGVKMISRGVLERLPIVAPPLATQRAIAAAAMIADRERRLAQRLADLKHSLVSTGLDAATRQPAQIPTSRSAR
ncbi:MULTISPECIES: hypothetical protein [Bacteria]